MKIQFSVYSHHSGREKARPKHRKKYKVLNLTVTNKTLIKPTFQSRVRVMIGRNDP